MTDFRLYIDGEWRAGGDGSYAVVNPATEQVVGEAPNASVQDALDAAAAARAAFPAWSRTTPEVRAELLDRAADLFDKRYEEFVPLVQAETGATLRVTKQMQVPMPAVRFRRYAKGALEKLDIPIEPGVMPSTALAPGGIIGGLASRAPVGVEDARPPHDQRVDPDTDGGVDSQCANKRPDAESSAIPAWVAAGAVRDAGGDRSEKDAQRRTDECQGSDESQSVCERKVDKQRERDEEDDRNPPGKSQRNHH